MDTLEEEGQDIIRALKPPERLVPAKPPYIACGEYLLSKQTTRQLPRHLKFEPLAERSVATKYHFVRKEFNKVEDDLRATRVKAAEQRKSMDKQWAKLREIQQDLRDSFIKFNEFLEQNEKKRERTTQKKAEMDVLLVEKSEELAKINKEYEQMKQLKKMLDEAIKQYIMYEKFLNEVAKRDNINFGNINGIFSRFIALVKARKDLTDRYKNYMQELERIRDETKKIIMEKFVQLKGLDNEVTNLHKRFEAVKMQAENAEQFHQQAYLEGQQKVFDIQCATDSCWQLYNSICKRRNMKPIYKNQPAKQLEVIKKYLRKLSLVNRMLEAIGDENWEPPTERDSSGGDSIVVNVVKTMLLKK